MKYVVQDLEDDMWYERPGRFNSLEAAIRDAWSSDWTNGVQIVEIPAGKIVWQSEKKS